MHHADAGFDRRRRIGQNRGRAVDEYRAFVRLKKPEQDIHERRLAGAVLPNDRVDLAALDGEVHPLVGDDRAKAFRDRSEFDGMRHYRTSKHTASTLRESTEVAT